MAMVECDKNCGALFGDAESYRNHVNECRQDEIDLLKSENTLLKEKIRILETPPTITVTAGNPELYDKVNPYCRVCKYPVIGEHYEKCSILTVPYGEWS